ncbi:homeobox protein cut-like 1 isoform X2 [Paramacrobiotus metropolitanus]|uniref:homeobox protein cut-like 1 isoform X2 n=1 Tax=Paramacrobiotus metropolitanus TaxID=2943436 RepID=UPI0024462AFA|nr:homeobox protein cut-like 1 isoform X2 [Paramacrobiotus metropolitanus]
MKGSGAGEAVAVAGMERRLSAADSEESSALQLQMGILRRELDRANSGHAVSVNGPHPRLTNGVQALDDGKLTLLAQDLNRANERATAAEYKIAELQQQLTSLQRQLNKTQQDAAAGDGTSRAQADGIARLRDELERLKSSYQAQFNRLEDQLSRLSSQNALLLSKLDQQRDYDTVKHQLNLLKSGRYQEDNLSNGHYESVMLARNRRIQEAENTAIRGREMDYAGIRRRITTNGGTNGMGGYSLPSPRGLDPEEPEDPDELYSDDLSDLESNLTPEMLAKIADAKNVLQGLSSRANTASPSGGSRFMNTMQVADQVNRVLEEEGITRCALAKFVLHGSYKMVYDALHDPRPWGFLNSAGRDKYRKLKLWAEDARCISAVKLLQVYCKDRRRRGDGSTPPSGFEDDSPTDLSLPKHSPIRRRSQADLLSMGYESPGRIMMQPGAIFHPGMRRPSMLEASESQALPVAPKRTSPQHSVPRRTASALAVPPAPISSSSGVFRPSQSFTASPVALGISFPDYRKNVLHQITDDMINQYDPLDTDTVTRAVRSKLNKCNVSQRLFGEVVLGMSQGAVSDLLKRPKPWNKLTRPTKEHYVRMQQFLEDEQSIPVLQAIQNREDPERVLQVPPEEDEERVDVRDMWKKEDSPQSSPSMVSIPSGPAAGLAPVPPVNETMASDSELSEREAFQAVKEHFAKFYQIQDVSRSPMLDTVVVASRIKEELRARNLQQKLIGELVLDVGQGTVSELLNKPKPYGMLSMKGRENYMKLMKLLQTAEDFTLLEALRTQGQQKATTKRGRSFTDDEPREEKRSRASPNFSPSHDADDELEVEPGVDEEPEGDAGERADVDRENQRYYRAATAKYSDDESTGDGHDDGQMINGVIVPKSAMRTPQRSHDTVIVQPALGGKMYAGGGSYEEALERKDSWGLNGRVQRDNDGDAQVDDKDWS